LAFCSIIAFVARSITCCGTCVPAGFDDELVQQMHDDLYDGLKEEIEEGVNILLERGWTPYNILTEGLVEGMRIVGIDFRDGILFVPEVLLAANAMKAGMAILKPLLAGNRRAAHRQDGDRHRQGRHPRHRQEPRLDDDGRGRLRGHQHRHQQPGRELSGALEEHQPDILGMSALLTTTMPYMKVVIDTMKEKGMRDDYIVLVGGAPLNEEFATAIGADAYCRDAAVAVETAKEFMARKHNQLIRLTGFPPAATAFQNPPGQSRRGGFSLYVVRLFALPVPLCDGLHIGLITLLSCWFHRNRRDT
jgi:methanogenic corrinoid protein MtbC1